MQGRSLPIPPKGAGPGSQEEGRGLQPHPGELRGKGGQPATCDGDGFLASLAQDLPSWGRSPSARGRVWLSCSEDRPACVHRPRLGVSGDRGAPAQGGSMGEGPSRRETTRKKSLPARPGSREPAQGRCVCSWTVPESGPRAERKLRLNSGSPRSPQSHPRRVRGSRAPPQGCRRDVLLGVPGAPPSVGGAVTAP